MILPWQDLSPEALTGVIEEFVTRDGTESSDAADKSEQVRRALGRGELVLVFDAELGTANLLPPDEVPSEDAPEQD